MISLPELIAMLCAFMVMAMHATVLEVLVIPLGALILKAGKADLPLHNECCDGFIHKRV